MNSVPLQPLANPARAVFGRRTSYTALQVLLAGVTLAIACSLTPRASAWNSVKVVPDPVTGRLNYPADSSGNRIPDFSNAGYKGGGVSLPTVPVVMTISPSGGVDDTASIQAAINTVGAMAVQANGYRGTLILSAGTYKVLGTLLVNKSGVVLSGVGNSTILQRTGTTTAEVIIAGGGTDGQFTGEVSNSRSKITTAFVQVGSRSFDVDTPNLYAVGDHVIVWHPSTQAWIDAVNKGGVTDGINFWVAGDLDIRYDRYVQAISGNTITIDAPVFNHLDKSLSQSYVYKYSNSGIQTNIGIKDLFIDIVTNGSTSEDHCTDAITYVQAENCWASGVTAQHFVHAAIMFGGSATRCTAYNCYGISPNSTIAGERRYNFCTYHAQLILFQNCYASYGRHSYVCNGTSEDSGIVFLNCTIDHPQSSSEPHRRWSQGVLYDSITVTNLVYADALAICNNSNLGTGHGWSAAHSVAWNFNATSAGGILLQQPPTAQNYAIGCTGVLSTGTRGAGSLGYVEGTGTSGLSPSSLYLKQLADRLTPVITWVTPSAINYGTALSATQFNATANIPGTFTYNPTIGTTLTAGTQTLSVTFTPTDTTATTTTATVTLTVNKATPIIAWPSLSAIPHGTALTSSQLNATANTAGTFSYSPASGTILDVGTNQSLSVTFTPTDAADYNTATAANTLTVTVGKITPTLTWATPSAINYGATLSATQLNASAGGLSGTFAYSPALGAVLNAGPSQTLSVTFTPTDTTNYTTATAATTLTVDKGTPTITWVAPTAIAAGTALSSSQLNATAGVPGTFSYSPASGTVLSTRTNQGLSAIFTPTDTTNYNPATATNSIAVNPVYMDFNSGSRSPVYSSSSSGTSVVSGALQTTGGWLRNFTAQTLTNTGDVMTWSFKLTVNGSFGTAVTTTATSQLRFGLFNSNGGGKPTADGWSGVDFTLYKGYASCSSIVGTDAGGSPISAAGPGTLSIRTRTGSATTSLLNSLTPFTTVSSSTSLSQSYALSTQYTLSISATKTATGTDISTTIAGGQFGNGVQLIVSDTTSPVSTFDTICLQPLSNVADSFTVDDVIVTYANSAASTPSIAWSAPAAINYGTALSLTQFNATSGGVPGTFTYSPTSGTVLNAGTHALTAIFTPTSNSTSNSTSAATTLTVSKLTPTITWADPSAINYGTALSSTQLNATTSIPGNFTYSPASGTVLDAGSSLTLTATFYPTDSVNYNITTTTAHLTVNKVTPTLNWTAPSAITYGTTLSSTQLNATSSIAGAFVYSPASAIQLNAGSAQTLSVTFTPTDTTNYTTTTTTTIITVNKATPSLAWSAPASLTYGTALSFTQLNATADVTGTFTYNPATGTVLSAGAGQTLSVTFTPTDTANYTTATTATTLTVFKATPAITWSAPAAITYPAALSVTQLNATANLSGTLLYNPDIGTVLTAGSGQPLSVTFTPTDTANYNPATATASLTVNKATPILAVTNSPALYDGSAKSASVTGSVPGTVGNIQTGGAATKSNAGTYPVTADFTPADPTNYNTLSAASAGNFVINKLTPTLSVTNSPTTYDGAGHAAAVTGSVVGTASNISTGGSATAINAGTYPVTADFAPADSTNYSSLTAAIAGNFVITKTTPALTWIAPAAIIYGTPLSTMQLNATAGAVAGSLVYSPINGAVLTAGTQTLSVTFTPNDTANYTTATAATTLTVNKATPALSWSAPAAITYGTLLTATQLNATAGAVAGTFVYSPASGAVLTAGTQTLSATFTPTDTANYTTTTTASTTLTVNKATATITLSGLSVIYDGTAKSVSATTSPAGLTVTSTYAGSSTAPSAVGTYAIIATVNDANYTGSGTGTLTIAETWPVIDTAQATTYNNSGPMTAPTVGQSFYGQDTQYSGNQPSYSLSPDAKTVKDNKTALIWMRGPNTTLSVPVRADKMAFTSIPTYITSVNSASYGGYSDWRLPTIKELYSLYDARGTDPSSYAGSDTSVLIPYINTAYFNFAYGQTNLGERIVDSQYASSTTFVHNPSDSGYRKIFGVNFSDGRIKGYDEYDALNPSHPVKTFFVQLVRGPVTYGNNTFLNNGDGTITDITTGLMWSQNDNASALNWSDALAWVQTRNAANYLGHNDWRMPNVKELQSIVNYANAPDYNGLPAIDTTYFNCSSITNEAGVADFPYYWSSTTHVGYSTNNTGATEANYIPFGRALGWPSTNPKWVDVHGAGCQRSDPKLFSTSNPYTVKTTITNGVPYTGYSFGPQGDAVRGFNYVRLVRDLPVPAANFNFSPAAPIIGQTVAFTDTSTNSPTGLAWDFGDASTSTTQNPTHAYATSGTWTVTLQARNSIGTNTVTKTVTVAKIPATVTLGSLAQNYDGSAKTATATTTPVGLAVTITYAGNSTAPTNAGTYAVVGAINDANYTGTASGTLTITKAVQSAPTISSAASVTFGTACTTTVSNAGSAFGALSWSLGTGSTAPGAAIDATTGAVTFTSIGTVVIRATFSGDANHNAATSADFTVTVGAAPTTFALSANTFTYTGSAQGPTINATPGNATFTPGGPITATNVGSYTATATATGNFSGTNNALAWSIAKASQSAPVISSANSVALSAAYTATVSNAGSAFGALSWSLGTGSTATGAAIDATTGAVTFTSIGTVVIRATFAGDSNHLAATSADFTVGIGTVGTSFVLSTSTFTYTGSAQGPTINATPGNATFTPGGTLTATNVGSYTATATATGNYTGTNNALAWSITKASQSAPVISSATTATFGAAYTATANTGIGALSWSLGAGSTASGAATDATTGAVSFTSAGNVVIRATFAGDSNHNTATSADFTITVAAAPTTFALSSSSFTYTGSAQGPTINAKPANATFTSGGTTSATNVGSYTATATATGNYTGSNTNLAWSIAKATATVTLGSGSLTQTYTGTAKTATATTTPTGLSVSITYAGSTTAPSTAGTYAVVATVNDANYTGTASGTLTITKVPLTATAANKARLYGDANPNFTISYTGFVNNDTAAAITPPTASTTATPTSAIGTYPITLTGGAAANYTLTLVPGTLSVTPRDYSGAYFGTLAGGGQWALRVRADNTATFIAYLSGRQSAIVVNLTVNPDGTFSVTGTEIKPATSGALSLANAESPRLRTAAAVANFTLAGTIGADGAFSGQLTGITDTLTGTQDTGTAQTPALYNASTSGGSAYAIVGPSGQALVVATTTTSVDAATGTMNSSGQLTATTAHSAQLSVTVNSTAQTLSASVTPSGSAPTNYTGAADTGGYLSNLSVRAATDAGKTLIVGFVVDGGAKPMLVRAAGPALNHYGLTGVTDPSLALYNGGTLVTSNNDWSGALGSVFSTLGAFPFDASSKDSALEQSLNGPHTAQATTTNAGQILVEAYDAGPNDTRKLTNLSARFQVGTGDNILIAGFVVAGTGTRQVLVRAVGPKLADYGVTGVLADPQFSVYDGGTAIATNNDWNSALAPTFDTVGAFQLNAASKDAALVVTLQAGKPYTVQVSGVNNTTGEALVELYLLP